MYPWVTSTCNVVADADQLRGVAIPDVHPADLVDVPGAGLSMVAGDFVVGGGEGGWARCVMPCSGDCGWAVPDGGRLGRGSYH